MERSLKDWLSKLWSATLILPYFNHSYEAWRVLRLLGHNSRSMFTSQRIENWAKILTPETIYTSHLKFVKGFDQCKVTWITNFSHFADSSSPEVVGKCRKIKVIDKIVNSRYNELADKFGWELIKVPNKDKDDAISVIFYDPKIQFTKLDEDDFVIFWNNKIRPELIKDMGFELIIKYENIFHSKIWIKQSQINDLSELNQYFKEREDQNIINSVTIKLKSFKRNKKDKLKQQIRKILRTFTNLKEINLDLSWDSKNIPTAKCLNSILSIHLKFNLLDFGHNWWNFLVPFRINSNQIYLFKKMHESDYKILKVKTSSSNRAECSEPIYITQNWFIFGSMLFKKVQLLQAYTCQEDTSDLEISDIANIVTSIPMKDRNWVWVPYDQIDSIEIYCHYLEIREEFQQNHPSFYFMDYLKKFGKSALIRIRFSHKFEPEVYKECILKYEIEHFAIYPKDSKSALYSLQKIETDLKAKSVNVYLSQDFKISEELTEYIRNNENWKIRVI